MAGSSPLAATTARSGPGTPRPAGPWGRPWITARSPGSNSHQMAGSCSGRDWSQTPRLWEVQTGRRIELPREADTARFAALSQAERDRLRNNNENTIRVALFSPDGGRLLLLDRENRRVRTCDTASGALVGPPIAAEGLAWLSFSPDGRLIGTGDRDRTAQLSGCAPLGREVASFSPADGSFRAATFSPDSQRLLVISEDTAQLWDIADGRAVGSPLRHVVKIRVGAFSPDRRTDCYLERRPHSAGVGCGHWLATRLAASTRRRRLGRVVLERRPADRDRRFRRHRAALGARPRRSRPDRPEAHTPEPESRRHHGTGSLQEVVPRDDRSNRDPRPDQRRSHGPTGRRRFGRANRTTHDPAGLGPRHHCGFQPGRPSHCVGESRCRPLRVGGSRRFRGDHWGAEWGDGPLEAGSATTLRECHGSGVQPGRQAAGHRRPRRHCLALGYPDRDTDGKPFKAGQDVFSMAFSPDGRLLATGCATPIPQAFLWDIASRLVRGDGVRFKAHAACLAFSPDGRASRCRGTRWNSRVIETATGLVRANSTTVAEC